MSLVIWRKLSQWWSNLAYWPCDLWAHLNRCTDLCPRKKFASLQSISPLIQIWLSLGASETSCATNTMYIKCPPLVFSIPFGSARKKWFWVSILIEIFICRSEQLIPTQKSSIQVRLQSYQYIMLPTPISGRISKGISEFFEERTFILAFVSELRKTKSQSCVKNRDSQLAFET